MDIRAILLLDNLRVRFSVLCCGRMTDTPLLRPVFYQESTIVEKNRIYMIKPGILPPKADLDESNLLICTEGFPSLSFQHSGLPLFIVQKENTMTVFNEILSIFEKYDVWEKALMHASKAQSDISELVQITAPLIMNDITVIDQDLRVLGAANYEKNTAGEIVVVHPTELLEPMPAPLIRLYKKGIEENRNKRGSYYGANGCYCVNFHQGDRYCGNLSLYPRVGKLNQSDPYIIDVLAEYVRSAIELQSLQDKSYTQTYQKYVRNLLDGKSVTKKEYEFLTDEKFVKTYHGSLFFYIPLQEKTPSISEESICQTLLKAFPHLLTFPYQNSVVGIYGLTRGHPDPEGFVRELADILDHLDLYAGISDPLYDIREVRFYYEQARYALDYQVHPQGKYRVVRFRDCTLRYLMMNSTGTFPAKYLCPLGLLRLREYDAKSNVDYLKTLCCYLDEQMNLAQTSKVLGIHRNTLIQRIERINGIIGLDLKDPMSRLWIRMAIYLLDEEEGCYQSNSVTYQ